MSFPQTPRNLVAELFVGSAWVDITSDVQQRDSITISRGRSSESAKVQPSSCSLTLNNRSGRYSPRNPLSPYYGQLGRNTPLRLGIRTITDAFSRTVSSGWGSTDTGETWDGLSGAGGTLVFSDWNVAAGKATHSVPATTAFRASTMNSTSYRDVDVAVTVTVGYSDVTGGQLEPANLILGGESMTDYYMVRVAILPTEAITMALMHFDGTTYVGPVTVPGLTHSSGQALRVRAQLEGQTLRAKVWAATKSEPYDWQVTATGITGVPAAGGFIGVRSGVGQGNTNALPITFSYDDVEVRVPRFAGEVATWPAKWDTSGKDAYVQIEAGGIMRRLGQGASPIQSTLRRYIPTRNPHVYWPLEEEKRAVIDEIRPIVGTGSLSYVPPTSGTTPGKIVWASDNDLPGGLQAPDLTGGASLVGFLSPDGLSTMWTLTWAQKMSTTSGSFSLFDTVESAIQLTPILDPATPTVLNIYLTTFGFSDVIMSYTFPSAADVDRVWHHYAITVAKNGTGVDFWLEVDGSFVASTSRASTTFAGLNKIQFSSPASSTTNTAIGHVAVFPDYPGATITDAAFGFAGETAGARILRLCSEEGIPVSYVGDVSTTSAMGPQRVDTLRALLGDCAEADMGTLCEPRGVVGLAYRTRGSLYNQTPAAILDYSAGQLAPSFEPVDDDQLTRNDVLAKRVDGGEYRAVLETGRMSVLDPQSGGVGRYDTSVTVNVRADTQLPDIAGWVQHLGTVDEARYPTINVNLANPNVATNAALGNSLLGLDVDDRLVITNARAANVYDDISQLARGYTETLNRFEHTLAINCAPASPYQVLQFDDGVSRWDSDDSTLNAGVTSSATSLSVKTTSGTLWTTDPAEMPISITVGGEQMSVTAISGTASPQTFTVTRSVNGVVKAQPAGAQVRLTRRATLAM